MNELQTKTNKRFLKYNYGFIMLSISIITSFYNAQNIYFFTELLGLSVFYLGICKFIHALYSGIIDTVIGFLSDKTSTRLGKRVPWLWITFPVLCLTFIFVFVLNDSNGLSQFDLFIYFLIVTLLFQTATSSQFINFSALFPNLFAENERRTAASIKQFANSFGFLSSMALLPIFLNFMTHRQLTIYICILFTIIYVPNLFFIKENRYDLFPNFKYSIFSNLKLFFSDKYFRYVSITSILNLATLAIIISYYLFYFNYVFNDAQFGNYILGFILLVTLASIPFWNIFIQKIGYLNAWKIATFSLSCSLFSIFFIQSKLILLIPSFIAGLSFGGTSVCPDIAMSKVIDIAKNNQNISIEGFYNSSNSLLQKIFITILPILLIPFMMLFGYQNGNNPGLNANLLFKFIITIIPSALIFIGFLSVNKFSFLIKTLQKNNDN